jgi:type IV pilus assembly protein PilE
VYVLRKSNVRRKRCGNRTNGFSLIELLIALAIMGILAVLAIPSYTKYMVKSRQVDAKTQLTAVRQAQEIYRLQYGAYTSNTALLSGWQGTVGKYAFSILSGTSSNFTAKASWTDGSERDAWTIDDGGTLAHTVNTYQIE